LVKTSGGGGASGVAGIEDLLFALAFWKRRKLRKRKVTRQRQFKIKRSLIQKNLKSEAIII
jgi:hypothetical protein